MAGAQRTMWEFSYCEGVRIRRRKRLLKRSLKGHPREQK
jgi:hypothetical protein